MNHEIEKIDKELSKAISDLMLLRNNSYPLDVNPNDFFNKVQTQVTKVINLYEPFFDKFEKLIKVEGIQRHSENAIKIDELSRKYNRMLDLCEAVD